MTRLYVHCFLTGSLKEIDPSRLTPDPKECECGKSNCKHGMENAV